MNRWTRQAAARLAAWFGAAPLLDAQQPTLIGEPPGRIAPAGELVNTYEFAAMAERRIGAATFGLVADGERGGFDRITLRPRMMVNAQGLDLTTELFGERMFAPILAGPVAGLARFHAEGDRAMAQGAAAAQTTLVVSSRSSVRFEEIAAQTKGSLWLQVYPEPDAAAVRARVDRAVAAGCKAVCVTVGGPEAGGADWKGLAALRQALGRTPVLLKGVMTPEDAREAAANGFSGVVVSNPGRLQGTAQAIDVLPAVADGIGGKIPILIDGGFRRGTDVLKALALGARAVLAARPAVWGLAAYGAPGVETLFRLLQNELARNMAMCGKVTLADLDRSLVRIHRR
ncbi:MAG: alpha-hydroxy-acid oxidizing protein [Acidobacteria bacterium]|nr:alpha-hydroxy-acid oxidizing protein [Acidobacteriota bacterium]